MLAAARILGKKNVWVGDIMQLPPVVILNEDKIRRNNYDILVEGLRSVSKQSVYPVFQLSVSYRLPTRAVLYTSLFYRFPLSSKVGGGNLHFQHILREDRFGTYLHSQGGPTLLKTSMPVSDFKPERAGLFLVEFVKYLSAVSPKQHISVLSFFVETVKDLQKKIYYALGSKKNILVDTVSRIQGLTTDICIYFIPNTAYHRSLETRLFNVATSRSKGQTFLIADKTVLQARWIDRPVQKYLAKLNEEHSFEVELPPPNILMQ
jgi:hypothetical protein